MLKLEKTSQWAGLAIRMRERESFFEPRVIKALAIALALHAIPLTLFHATPFIFSSTYLFPPINVQMELPLQGVSVTASPYIEEEEMLLPPIAVIPAINWSILPPESALAPTLNLETDSFQQLEKRIWPEWQEALPMAVAEEPKIKVSVSGELANHKIISSDLLLLEKVKISSTAKQEHVSYEVRLDQKTGELFWYELIESGGSDAVKLLTEKLLLNFRFLPTYSPEFVLGELHFTVSNHD